MKTKKLLGGLLLAAMLIVVPSCEEALEQMSSVPMYAQFEDAEQLKEYEGNKEMAADERFINAIDPAYLKGYMGINIKSSSSYDPNSAANQVNRLFGMNRQGSEIVRASMFANRYPFGKAFELFGAVSGCGAQRP